MPALIFDCDGVLADTERDGHRPAFNATFAEVGLPVEWSEAEYGVKLQIGGGKEKVPEGHLGDAGTSFVFSQTRQGPITFDFRTATFQCSHPQL